MSPEATTGLFTLAAAITGIVLGSGGTLLAERLGYRHQRNDALDDRLYQERSSAYIRFVEEAHQCAHDIGKLARHPELAGNELPTPELRTEIAYNVDAFVARYVRTVEIVGPESVESAAQAVLQALYVFRNQLLAALTEGKPVLYDLEAGSTYRQLLEPYREDREAFVEAAKQELARLSKRSDPE